MVHAAPREASVSAVEGLECRRSIEPVDERQFLVIVRFRNTRPDDLAVRVVEDVPSDVASVTVVTTAGGDPRACRQIGDWIVHEPKLPGTDDRRTAYLLETTGESQLTLPPPRIEDVEPIDSLNARQASATADGSAKLAIDDAGEDTPTEITLTCDTVEETTDGERSPDTVSPDNHAILEELLVALEDDSSAAIRDELRAALGITPSERARFVHLQSRLDDLAAYVEALEMLVDEHGLDVIEKMQSSIEENTSRTEALREDVDTIEVTIDRQRAAIDDELAAVRTSVREIEAGLQDRLKTIESELEATSADVRTLETDLSRTKTDVTAVQERLGGIDSELETVHRELELIRGDIEDIDSSVNKFETFRERFRSALTSDPEASGRDGPSHGERR